MERPPARRLGAVWLWNIVLLFSGVMIRPSNAGLTSSFLVNVGNSSSIHLESSSCNFTIRSMMRSVWHSEDEPCNQKLPFEYWIYMKAVGTEQDLDAYHVRNECLKPKSIGVVELVTPEDWDTSIMDEAPGQLLRETERAASYLVENALDFEAICADDQVTKVSRIDRATVKTPRFPRRKSDRHLQETVSEAGYIHGVDFLISGLESLGCERTTGEDQTLCVMSDSFNHLGGMFGLMRSGDLPPLGQLTVIEELSFSFGLGTDEGSAMVELAYDIASGANFKFNTMFEGTVAAADDVRKLGTADDEGGEGCDVIVDDVSQSFEPGFRDGVISEAVDEVVAGGSLYFSSAGNFRNGYKFTSDWECATDILGDVTIEPCDNGVASHVFNPNATGTSRYLLPLDGDRFSSSGNNFVLHWDDDEGTSRSITMEIWSTQNNSETEFELLDREEEVSDAGTAVIVLNLPDTFEVGDTYFITIYQEYSDLDDVEMRLLSRTDEIFSDFSDGSIFGQQCAASTISVAAFTSWDASGDDNRFADPEEGSVASYSSRGPCYIDSGNGLEERLKPVTTAATALEVSTNPDRFELFGGTSASAPVAAAIATIVRAACFPRVVTLSDMMEMLTDYTYTIDVTSDADGEEETWGPEAGYGIISGDKILGWIAANCQESCPGSSTAEPSTPVPTPATIPISAPTTPAILPPSESPVESPTPSPVESPLPPTSPPSTSPPAAPVSSPIGELVEASERTTVEVTTNGYDERSSGYGCSPNGCVATNTRDGDLDPSSRWSCKENLLGGTNCEITYTFGEPQDIARMLIAFYRGDERTRVLKVRINGSPDFYFESSGETQELEEFELDTTATETLSLEGMELGGDDWIALIEVQFLVA